MASEKREDANHQSPKQQKKQFLFPLSKYYGEFNLPYLAFDANLQEFAQKIFYVCNLETNGKISSEDAYEHIKNLWEELKASKKNLLGDSDEDSDIDRAE